MNIPRIRSKLLVTTILASALLGGCASVQPPEGSAEVRQKLTRLQANQELASRAPVAIKEAEAAVREAELPESDEELASHRLVMADYKIEIARSRAQARLYEDQRTALTREAEAARLASRTQEADRAHQDKAVARQDAAVAEYDAAVARQEAQLARDEAEAARQEAIELKRQLQELEGRETERGIIITLGDVLFATGKAELADSANTHLVKLADFLKEYPDSNVIIEGHTDSVGSYNSNMTLSQNRADSVRNFLVSRGVASSQLSTVAMGPSAPVASNDSAAGRQQNRRVEIIIEKDNGAES